VTPDRHAVVARANGRSTGGEARLARVVDAPIGVFDSGVGGLTVARAILDLMPHEPVRYVGDTARGPYGPLPIATVRSHALDIADMLVSDGVKALVIACNSASSAILRDARERYSNNGEVPVIEVIHPAVRTAAAVTRNGRVGVIGTRATIMSRAYEDAFAAAPHLAVFGQACPRFVEFVEAGITHGEDLEAFAHLYLDPLRDEGVDTLILGCTHYPLLAGIISYVMGPQVTLVSSADETARDLYRALRENDLLRSDATPPPRHTFFATGDPENFAVLGQRFLGPEVSDVRQQRVAA
jgi:glutamate racemase